MQNIHDGLISILKSIAPKGENPVHIITDILPISKEGAYRRLRGEILFTLDETVILAKKLEISIDNLIEINWEDKYDFYITPFTVSSYAEKYYQTMSFLMETYIHIKKDLQSRIYIASKTLTPTLYFKYKEFTQFTLFKWIYMVDNNVKHVSFSDVIIPPKLEQLSRPFVKEAMEINTTYILDDFMFTAIAKDLLYYYKIRLLTKNDIETLKSQILSIIDDLEEIASKGRYESGTNVSIYITDTYFDASYHYVSGNNFEACGIGAYGLNFLSCLNSQVVKSHKTWIESLMKYSTSITQSGKVQRLLFFNKQREKLHNVIV